MKNLYSLTLAVLFTASNVCVAQLSGAFTVGTPSSDYPSLTAAITALQASSVGAGGVTLTIAAGTYQENIVLGGITGIGQASPLLIMATPGSVTFQGTGTTVSTDAVFLINALSFVTIDGITIEDISAPGSDVEFGIRFVGTSTTGCRNNTIRNCAITLGPNAARPSVSTRGILFNSSAASPAATNNDNVIDNVTIDNSSWGIQFRCAADFLGRITQTDVNNAVINSTFGAVRPLGHDLSGGALAINALGGRDMLIDNNVVVAISNLNSAPALPVSTSGISLDSCSGVVSNNIIDNLEYQGTPGAVFGIRSSTLLGAETLIVNNVITNLKRSDFVASTTDPSLSITGIWIFNQGGNNGLARVLHNSIYLDAAATFTYSTAGINLSGGSTGRFLGDVFNNIVVNNIGTTNATYRSFALIDGNTPRGFLRSDNNILFANGANGYLGAIGRELGGTEQFSNDLTVFQTFSATNQASANFLPLFNNAANGDLSFPLGLSNQNAYLVPTLTNVTMDINGVTRFTPQTFAGAYESPESLSIGDVRALDLRLYPNPVNDVLTVANLTGGTVNSIRVYDILGSLIVDMTQNDLQSNIEVNVQNLKTGMYLIRVQGSEGSTTKKFVKN